jgi:hypothetical protein
VTENLFFFIVKLGEKLETKQGQRVSCSALPRGRDAAGSKLTALQPTASEHARQVLEGG